MCFLIILGGLDEESVSMAEQITTISRSKLIRYIGSLSEDFMKAKINKSIRIQLGLEKIEKTVKKDLAKSDSPGVPIWHKSSMTVEEASEYSNIGINRIRELCKDPLIKISFQVGRKILIKREAFDEYLNNVELI